MPEPSALPSPPMPQIPHMRNARDEIGYALRTIIDNNQFLIAVVLSEKKPNRSHDELPAFGRWHDAADKSHEASSLTLGSMCGPSKFQAAVVGQGISAHAVILFQQLGALRVAGVPGAQNRFWHPGPSWTL